jgi:caspase domain-containing protein/WD40 domain-containing protein
MRRFYTLLVVATAASMATTAVSAAPPTSPIPRLETGMHTAVIKRIATDREARWLATASADKTVRIWETASGLLLRVLRPPIGQDEEGMQYAVAISPDGEWVATSGWTGTDGRSNYVYIFSRQAGTLVKAIPGHDYVINDLAWSPDGRFLAATLWGGGGLHVYRTGTFDLVGATPNRDCERDSYGADFDAAGRLVVVCFDGMVRLYRIEATGLRRLGEGTPPGGNRPFSARFSPDGRRIAVGFEDSTAVALLDGATLQPLKPPDTSGVTNGNLFGVAFSSDGRFLYAAGTWSRDGKNPIRRWSAAGNGAFVDLPGPINTVMDLRPIPGGGVAFGAHDPAWGVINGDGRKTAGGTPAIADLRAQLALRLSRDGLRVAFGYEEYGKSPAIFDLAARSLITGGEATGLDAARTKGQPDADWKDTLEPKLYGKPIKLYQYERSRSLAIAPNSERIALGSEWYVRLFDRSGTELWKTSVPGVAWAINVSRDSRFVVAALGDGTLRWYRMADGEELLAFFPHADRKRWVLWTLGAYYDAAPGAEDLIGWHVNRGVDQAADFFPVSRFREQYYRPDVVSKVLEVADEAKAVALANEALGRQMKAKPLLESLPPVVQIVSSTPPSTALRELPIEYRVRTGADAPVTALRMRVNGRNIDLRPGTSAEKSLLLAQLEPGENEILLFAQNRHAWSSPATVRIVRHNSSVPPTPAPDLLPRLLVLAVGVADYPSEELKLDFAAKDAARFADALKKQEGRTYRKVEVRPLFDGKATRPAIEEGLEWLQSEAKDEDTVMVFLSGHGMNDKAGSYYFLPVGAHPEKLVSTALSFATLKNALLSVRGTRTVFVDTCRAGGVMGGRRASIMDVVKFVGDLTDGQNGVVVFASSTGLQPSLENPKWGGSAFATALIEGIAQGKAAAGNGEIRRKRLDSYVSERVVELTEGRQEPVSPDPQGTRNFLLARYP